MAVIYALIKWSISWNCSCFLSAPLFMRREKYRSNAAWTSGLASAHLSAAIRSLSANRSAASFHLRAGWRSFVGGKFFNCYLWCIFVRDVQLRADISDHLTNLRQAISRITTIHFARYIVIDASKQYLFEWTDLICVVVAVSRFQWQI